MIIFRWSFVTDHMSMIICHWSYVNDHLSLIICHWSFVNDHFSVIIEKWRRAFISGMRLLFEQKWCCFHFNLFCHGLWGVQGCVMKPWLNRRSHIWFYNTWMHEFWSGDVEEHSKWFVRLDKICNYPESVIPATETEKPQSETNVYPSNKRHLIMARGPWPPTFFRIMSFWNLLKILVILFIISSLFSWAIKCHCIHLIKSLFCALIKPLHCGKFMYSW